MKKLSRRAHRPEYKFKYKAKPAFRRVEIEQIAKIDDRELTDKVNVIVQPGSKFHTGFMPKSVADLSTRWQDFNVHFKKHVRNMACKEIVLRYNNIINS